MIPSFNTAGRCIPGEHYMLPPGRRVGHVMRLIDERKYFTLHAGRQMGKTTCAFWIVKHLNEGDRFKAIWIDIETAREKPDPAAAFRSILNELESTLSWVHKDLTRPSLTDIEDLLRDPSNAIVEYLRRLCAASPRPLVLLIDEADGLVGEAMVSLLTQLRRGYMQRAEVPFPSSVVLVGQRQVRDYVLSTEERRAVSWLGTTSPFNITAEAQTLGAFTREEVAELLNQHTQATGQLFLPEAIERIAELGQGHPWLTNAIADQIVNRDVEDRSVAVTAAHVDAAKETIILARRSHIDSLIARLREPRVARVISPMLAGETTATDVLDEDVAYVAGLGLIVERGRHYVIANPIYREVIPRALTHLRQMQILEETAWYVRPDGGLDVQKLMTAWQKFWRIDGHLGAEGFGYREAGPHLMLMAFLQRVVNGGGRVEREYGLGKRALDLMIVWRDERHAVEVKVRRSTETQADALEQVTGYLDQAGLDHGWLVMFDLRKTRSWKQKLTTKTVKAKGKRVTIVGC